MRIDIKKTEVYPFSELSDDAKQTVFEKLADINVDYEWWDSIFEDAANVGIKLTVFDIGRRSSCHGTIDDATETANKILKEHGKGCETYKTAKAYLDDMPRNNDAAGNDYGDIDNEFRYSILEDYRIMLQKGYEYLISEEAIIEAIEANEYEFTEDGKIYH